MKIQYRGAKFPWSYQHPKHQRICANVDSSVILVWSRKSVNSEYNLTYDTTGKHFFFYCTVQDFLLFQKWCRCNLSASVRQFKFEPGARANSNLNPGAARARYLSEHVKFNALKLAIEKILQSIRTVRVAHSFFKVLDFATVPTRALNWSGEPLCSSATKQHFVLISSFFVCSLLANF